MSDHWTSPPVGHAFAGQAARDRPILTREGLGPWGGSVTVTPIPRLGRLGTQFAVDVQWTGPPISVPPHDADAHAVNPSWDGPAVAASDCYYTDDQQLAIAVAELAARALQAPRRPDLRAVALLLKRR